MESIGTVKAFFVFFGSLGIVGCIAVAVEGQGTPLFPLVGLCLAILYLCVGLFLRALLARHAWLVSSLLIGGFFYTLVGDVASAASGEGLMLKRVMDFFFRLFLTFYLILSVKKLAREVKYSGLSGGAAHNPTAQADA